MVVAVGYDHIPHLVCNKEGDDHPVSSEQLAVVSSQHPHVMVVAVGHDRIPHLVCNKEAAQALDVIFGGRIDFSTVAEPSGLTRALRTYCEGGKV
eukprot:1181869-Prorocentrum_minimum.AAC.4